MRPGGLPRNRVEHVFWFWTCVWTRVWTQLWTCFWTVIWTQISQLQRVVQTPDLRTHTPLDYVEHPFYWGSPYVRYGVKIAARSTGNEDLSNRWANCESHRRRWAAIGPLGGGRRHRERSAVALRPVRFMARPDATGPARCGQGWSRGPTWERHMSRTWCRPCASASANAGSTARGAVLPPDLAVTSSRSSVRTGVRCPRPRTLFPSRRIGVRDVGVSFCISFFLVGVHM
jgi:hypothetical protein